MSFDLGYALQIIPDILWASLLTLGLAAISGVAGIVIGLLLALGRRGSWPLAAVCATLVNAVRLSPFLVQLYFVFYVLPVWGLTLPATAVGVIALAVNTGAYLAGVFGAGFAAVGRGQTEAAHALGLHRMQVLVFVLAPQVVRLVAQPTAGYLMSLLKTTPYLSVIGVPEMLGTAYDFASDSFRYVEPLTVAGILFLTYCVVIAAAVNRLAARLSRMPAG